MTESQIDELFTSGVGKRAHRLVLVDEVDRQLGVRRETPASTRPMPLFGE